VLAIMFDMLVGRPGCHGRAYVCLRLYAFNRDSDSVPCWPACTRCTPVDTCLTMDRESRDSTVSLANVSVSS